MSLNEASLIARIEALPPGAAKDRAYECLLLAVTQTRHRVPVSPLARPLENKGWRIWYAEMFGQSFVDGLDSAETPHKHQSAAIEWHWNTRHALIKLDLTKENLVKQLSAGIITPGQYERGNADIEEARDILAMAYFTIWSRGNMKTTIARRVAIADACLTVSYNQGGYCLVVGGTKEKVKGTAGAIETLLTQKVTPKGEISNVWKYYPGLADAARNSKGYSKSWTAEVIQTAAGYVYQFVGLREGMAGANVEGIRPTLILPDDIDDRRDSPIIAENNFQRFTTEVLPMRQHNTIVWWAQNLISRFSCMYRVQKQHVRVLTNRVMTEPIPAVTQPLTTEARVMDGIVRDVVIWEKSGRPTWRGWSRQRVQQEINTEGLPSFKKECQHDVEESKEGVVLQSYDDKVAVITRDEFASVYGTRDLPSQWWKYVGNDWARTKTKYHANVAGVVTVSSQNTAFPGAIFIWYPKSFEPASQPDDVARWFLQTISPVVWVNGEAMTWDELITSSLENANIEKLTPDLNQQITQRRAILANVIPARVRPILKAQNYRIFRMSHERTDIQRIMKRVFGLPFSGTNPGSDGGQDILNLYMKVDYNEEHPFRPGHKGFTKFFIVVDSEKDLLYQDALDPKELVDAQLLRYQLNNWRFRDPFLTVKGETEGQLLKMNDDFPNMLQMLFHDNIVRPAPLDKAEHFDATLPVKLQQRVIETTTDPLEKARRVAARDMAERKVVREEQQKSLTRTTARNRLAHYRRLKNR